jgi:hypothetical protein
MSTIASIMALVSSLTPSEKLQLNTELAATMAGGKIAPAAKTSRKGKPAAPGTMAWSAFIEHAKTTMPERFAPPALPKDRMAIAKAIKAEDPEAYKAFCAKYVAEHPKAEVSDAASDAGSKASEPAADAKPEKADKPKRVMTDEQKAKMKEGREKAKAAKDAAKAAGETPPPKKAKAAPKVKSKELIAAETQAKTGGSGIPPAPAAVSIPQPVFEDCGMEKVTIEGDEYFLCTANNNLYTVEKDGLGAYVGRYEPTEEEKINFDAEESD